MSDEEDENTSSSSCTTKSLQADLQIKSIDYNINSYLTNNDQQFVIELREIDTANLWKGVFEANYIEELTRKTGNYKAFNIFVNMFQTALKNESSTVGIDVLTYSDLEELRNKKSSNSSKKQPSTFSTQDNKRFLILTYNVEFDRISYPLQLNYQGKSDVNFLLETIEKLKGKIKSIEQTRNTSMMTTTSKSLTPESSKMSKTINKLEKENQTLRQEKEALEMLVYQKKQKGSKYIEDFEEADNLFNVQQQQQYQKDIKLLKQIIKTLEEKSLKEKNMFQKQLQKKRQEIDILREQLSEKKIIETNLKNELRILSNELKMQQRHRSSSHQKRSCSHESTKRSVLLNRPDMGGNRLSGASSRQSAYFVSSNHHTARRDRSASPAVSLTNRKATTSPCQSVSSIRSNSASKKFNPTEYVNRRRSKIQEAESRKKSEIRKRMSSTGSNGVLNRSGSNISNASNNSIESNLGYSFASNSSQFKNGQQNYRSKNSMKGRPNKQKLIANNDEDYDADLNNFDQNNQSFSNNEANQSRRSRSPKLTFDIYNRDKEMKEIDLKLKSLQLLIKNNNLL